jgi:hypothetical protein
MSLTVQQLEAIVADDGVKIISATDELAVVGYGPLPGEIGVNVRSPIKFAIVSLGIAPEDYDGADELNFVLTIDGVVALSYIDGLASFGDSWTGVIVPPSNGAPCVLWMITLNQKIPPLWVDRQNIDLTIDIEYNYAEYGCGFELFGLSPLGLPEETTELATQWSFRTSTLDMYKFVLRSIRLEDQANSLFLKRFLEGPNKIWAATQQCIFDLENLWDLNNIKDEHLFALKRIVGWTPDLDYLTDELDADALKRLISVSIPLWQQRGSETTLVDFLSLLSGAQACVWNWFDLRWISDLNILAENHHALDSWILELPGMDGALPGEYLSNLRIVDNGNLDTYLVKSAAKIMRASGERILITYVDFMELFAYSNDTTQWDIGDTDFMVSNGTGKLADITKNEFVMVSVDGCQDWTDSNCYWRFRITSTGGAKAAMMFYCSGSANGYALVPVIGENKIGVYKVVLGAWTLMGYAVLDEIIYPDVWYGLRMQALVDVGNIHIQLFISGNLVFDQSFASPDFTKGSLGLLAEIDATLEIDEMELIQLPIETELVDINQ